MRKKMPDSCINLTIADALYKGLRFSNDFETHEPRSFVYTLALKMIKKDENDWQSDHSTQEAILLLLWSWNFAAKETKKLNFNNLGQLLQESLGDLKTLECVKIEDINGNNENIKNVFGKFKDLMGQTGASKALSLLNPDLFMMWDTKIRRGLGRIIPGIDNGSTVENYINYLNGIKEIIEQYNIRKNVNNGDKVLKKLDEFHYVKFVLNR